MQMFFQIEITSKNTGFLPSYDTHHVDQLLKHYGVLGRRFDPVAMTIYKSIHTI